MSALLQRCGAIGTSTWSDVLDRLGVGGAMQGLMLRSGAGCIAGPAVTVREFAGQLGAFSPEAFAIGEVLDAVTPGSVLTVALGGACVSSCGGLAALAARERGAAGVVIDGGCRDLSEIRETGLWLASRHVTPLSGKGRIRVDAVGLTVNVAGVTVRPGDIIIGDETGAVCVPAERLAEALRLAEELAAKDAEFARGLRAGASFRETSARLRYL